MSHVGTTAPAPLQPRLQRMSDRDWGRIEELAGLIYSPSQITPAFGRVLRAPTTIGYLAEVEQRLAGFLLYESRPQPGVPPLGLLERARQRLHGWAGKPLPQPFDLILLEAAVAPAWPQLVIEWALLERLGADLRQLGPSARCVVPEKNLAAQQFLRAAGYRATRVLHHFYLNDDGYLMAWPSARTGGPGRDSENRLKRHAAGPMLEECIGSALGGFARGPGVRWLGARTRLPSPCSTNSTSSSRCPRP